MLDSEATSRRRGPGRHRRTLTRQRRPIVLTLLRLMQTWVAKVKRER
jgi:hypothetical protein